MWTKKKHEEYRLKALVRGRLITEIRSGRIKRLPCVVCGDPNSEAHHKDYTKPKEVIFLCRSHHREHHRKEDAFFDEEFVLDALYGK